MQVTRSALDNITVLFLTPSSSHPLIPSPSNPLILSPSHLTLSSPHPLLPPQVLPELMVSVVAVIASMDLDVINQVTAVVVERGGGGAPTAVRIAQNEVSRICYNSGSWH